MKEAIIPVFTCDYCGKKKFRKCDMSRHEKWCRNNPNNQHKCFQFCRYLVKSEEEYEGRDQYDYDETFTGKKTVFHCALTNQKMYSFIAERKKLPVVNESDAVRMPLECESFKDQYTEFDLEDINETI